MAGYRRPVRVEVDLAAVARNARLFRNLVGRDKLFMAVVKANGYGHGAHGIAETALANGADRLGVALVEEGVALRRAGVDAPIQVLGETPPDGAPLLIDYDLTATVASLPAARAVAEEAARRNRQAQVHVKIDTGMNRLGLSPLDFPRFFSELRALPSLKIEGIFTHFAVADDPDSTFTQTQLERFLSATESLPGTEQTLIRHAANSAATILDTRTHLGMVRVGIALYGLHPSKATVGRAALSPALSLKAEVASVKHIGAGEGVSYGLTYRASGPTRIALVPAGYGDGYSRLLSNAAEVLIGGRRLTVSGTVCMDQFMVDVGNHPVAAGDEVVLIGKQGAEEITVDEIARHMGTINYEVTCLISQRVPRLYRGAGHGS